LHPHPEKPERIEAHLFVAFLAYSLSITLRQRLKALAGGRMPRLVFERLAALQLLDVRAPATDGRELAPVVRLNGCGEIVQEIDQIVQDATARDFLYSPHVERLSPAVSQP
jgi:hypothetical protein